MRDYRDVEFDWDINGNDYLVRVRVYAPVSGRTQGDPNDCYAPEPAEADTPDIYICGDVIKGEHYERHGFTAEVLANIEDRACEIAFEMDE